MKPTGTTLVLLLVLARTANAADEDPAVTAASALFESGVRKMEVGRCEEIPVGNPKVCAEACDDFRDAYAKYPAGLGALRNLAFVEKGLGLVASASRHFRELAEKAPLDPKPARRLWADYARTELSLLAPRVPHLTIAMPKPAPTDSRVTLDDVVVSSSQYTVAIPVDPGAHVVRVEAPGHLPFTRAITLAEGDSAAVDVTLTALDKPKLPPIAPIETKEAPAGPPRMTQAMLFGAGAATLAVGLGFGVAAIYKRDQACAGASCDLDEWERGRGYARASTILTVAGGVAAASGVVWYLLTPSAQRPTATAFVPYASPDGAGLGLVRSF